jgi:DnaK suppressor protein
VGAERTKSEYREMLERERDELRARLAELGVGGEGLQFDTNFGDSSQVTAERSELERLARELKEALDDVEVALKKLEEGTYGICEMCKKEIAPARLEAMPAVRYCIDCAAKRR